MNLNRRTLLGLIGTLAAAFMVGCRPQSVVGWWRRLWSRNSAAASVPPCIVRPEQMEGPYFVDERLHRSDIRSDPSDGSMKEGVPLQVAIRVHEIRGDACTPLPNVMVDLWHCDAHGTYSDVRDDAFDTRGKKFLRGYQMTDTTGTAQFLTIYPGWYPGRTVHIHFKIRTEPESMFGYEFTSQIYFDDTLTDQVFAHPSYTKGQRTTNRQDGIFEDGGNELMLPLTKQEEGYIGTFDIGLQLS